jgi:hypothetical protein
MKGHDALIAMRKEGGKPKGVWICHAVDNAKGWATWQKYKGFDAYPEVEILPTEVPELLDLRFAVGLVVHISGMNLYEKAKRLHKAFVDAKAKRVITVCGGLIIDSESGEWSDYVPE